MSKEKDIEYTTPDQYRLAHKKWAKAQEEHEHAERMFEIAEENLGSAGSALVESNMDMQDASAGLARYTVDEVE